MIYNINLQQHRRFPTSQSLALRSWRRAAGISRYKIALNRKKFFEDLPFTGSIFCGKIEKPKQKELFFLHLSRFGEKKAPQKIGSVKGGFAVLKKIFSVAE